MVVAVMMMMTDGDGHDDNIKCSRSYLLCLWPLTYLVNSHSSLNRRLWKEASYTSITVELKWTCWGYTRWGRRRKTTESGSSLLDRRNDGTLSGFLMRWMPSINLSTWQSFVILHSLRRISLICCSLRVRKTSVSSKSLFFGFTYLMLTAKIFHFLAG